MARRNPACHRSRPGRTCRTRASGCRRHRQRAPRHYASPQHSVRRAAARKRDSAPAVLGGGLRTAERTQSDLLRERGQEQRMLGDAVFGVPRRRRSQRRQQSDRAFERHRHLCRQGHRLPALEIRPAGQGLSLQTADPLYRWPRGLGIDRRTAAPSGTPLSAKPHRSTTSSTRASLIFRTWWWRACALSASKSRRSTRFTSPTKWWRFRPAAAPIWASSSPPEDARRPYIEVSGRKGLGVKADDLMDKLIESALQ